jgi:membrane-associated phospholipid phosphatase
MYNLILTTIIAETCYLLWPNQQLLRPVLSELGRANPLTWVVNIIYTVDSNTNVCPSLHCIGAFAVFFCSQSTRKFRTPIWTTFFAVFALMICASTVFIKQHSILDFFAALPVVAVGWLVVYLPTMLKARK